MDTTVSRPWAGAECVNSVNSVTPERDADAAGERAAIMSEPTLPPPGTAERERVDRQHNAMLAGLMTAAAVRPVPCKRRATARQAAVDLKTEELTSGREEIEVSKLSYTAVRPKVVHEGNAA